MDGSAPNNSRCSSSSSGSNGNRRRPLFLFYALLAIFAFGYWGVIQSWYKNSSSSLVTVEIKSSSNTTAQIIIAATNSTAANASNDRENNYYDSVTKDAVSVDDGAKLEANVTTRNNREEQTKQVKKYNSTNFLQFYVEARGQYCKLRQKFKPNDISYCAVARSGSTTLYEEYFTHHNHDCSVKDLERLGARRIVIVLRHPLARISSGFSRRMEGKLNWKRANRLIYDNFRNGGVELYISALRDVYHPLHDVAFNATFGYKRQSYFMPVTEFYLRDSQGKAEVYFVCMESFQDDLEAAWAHWKRRPNKKRSQKKKRKELFSSGSSGNETLQIKNPSLVSSGNWTNVLSRFSRDSIQWVEKTFENDLHLYQRHCPGGYESYIESLSKKIHHE